MFSARVRRAAVRGGAAFFCITTGVALLLTVVWPSRPVNINVRWASGVTDAERAALERRFSLAAGEPAEGTTWRYQLLDASTATIRALVEHARVEDTAHLNRIRFRPEFGQDRVRQIVAYSVVLGFVGALVWLLVGQRVRRAVKAPRPPPATVPSHELFFGPPASPAATGDALPRSRVPAVACMAAAAVTAVTLVVVAGASVGAAVAALLVVYVCGYVGGSLLVVQREGVALAVIRTAAGLLLTTIAFLLSLVVALPWFAGPVVAVVAAAVLRRRRAFELPDVAVTVSTDGLLAGVLAGIAIAPVAITYVLMAPGPFPPVFYNIDTAYTLEKVHALATTDVYPPWSLSNTGVRRTYHYGSQAMAALVSRSSGLLPHHALFLIVLPLLTAGVLAAAAVFARRAAGAVPRCVAVPLLLISTPALSIPFWDSLGPQLWTAVTSDALSFREILVNFDRWGILSNEGPNVGSDFLILGSLAGIAAASTWGWMLPLFLIGSAVLVKTTVGIALVAGFTAAEVWRLWRNGESRPSPQLAAAVAVFAVVFVAFFLVAFENNFQVRASVLDHLREMRLRGYLRGVTIDAVWLLLPALVVATAGIRDPAARSAPYLLMALGPLLVVNTSRMENIGDGGAGAGDDWFQILHAMPFLLHAFALSSASRRWDRIARWRKAAVLALMVLAIAPVTAAAVLYTLMVVRAPAAGTDFVDNRMLAGALSAIPVEGSVIVTNDLRYPAGQFTRDYRQMQIPALFGHQAFAVNYAHEAVDSRRPLQRLLQQPQWSDAIGRAAREHQWTHFLVRKDYAHPVPIPLVRVFENDVYEVYRFP